MRSSSLRSLASVAVASALGVSLLVAAPAASVEQPATATGSVIDAEIEGAVDPAGDYDVPSFVDEPAVVAGRTLLRFQVAMGDEDPVVGGRLIVTNINGRVLARGRTDINGQTVILAKKTLPDRGVVRVTQGRSNVLKGRAIDLRAFFDPSEGDIVYVNPLSTLDETCRSGNLGTLCSQTVDSFYELPEGVKHRTLVHTMRNFFDGTTFSRETKRRGMTTWQWSQRIVAKAYAGKVYRGDISPRARTDETTVGTSALAGLVTKAAAKGAMKWAGGQLAGGALGAVGGLLMNKLLVAAGWADEGVTKKDVEDIRRDLGELKQAINQVIEGQALIRADVASLDEQVRSGRYYSEVQAFDSGKGQSSALDFLAEELSFILTSIDCANTTPDAPRCNDRFPVSMPDGGDDLGVCSAANLELATSRWARSVVAQCAWVGEYLRNYVNDFSFGRAAAFVRGGSAVAAGSVGLIPLGQDQYNRTVLKGTFDSVGQGRMIDVGAYWLNKWAVDITAWTLATQQPAVLRRVMAPETAANRTSVALADWNAVEQDTTGRFFPRQMQPTCREIVYDDATKALYARGIQVYFNANANNAFVRRPNSGALPEQSPAGGGYFPTICSDWVTGPQPGLRGFPLKQIAGRNWLPVARTRSNVAPISIDQVGPVLNVMNSWPGWVNNTLPGATWQQVVPATGTALAFGRWGEPGGCSWVDVGGHRIVSCPYVTIGRGTTVLGNACVSSTQGELPNARQCVDLTQQGYAIVRLPAAPTAVGMLLAKELGGGEVYIPRV